MAWTKLTKPTTSNWSWDTPIGRTNYDDPLHTYDDASDFYDTVNQAAWTNVNKPSSSSWTKVTKPV